MLFFPRRFRTVKKFCKICKGSFYLKSPNQIYCSAICRRVAQTKIERLSQIKLFTQRRTRKIGALVCSFFLSQFFFSQISYASFRYNPFERKYEMASQKAELKYNPFERKYQYVEKNSELKYNPYKKKYESLKPNKNNGFND
jgi:hypothetical protein